MQFFLGSCRTDAGYLKGIFAMKTLLVIHDLNRDIDALEPFAKLAEDTNAHLNVVVVGMVRAVPVTAAPGVPAYYYDESNSKLVEAGRERVSEIEEYLQTKELSASTSLECRDPVVIQETILGHAMFADATVFANQSILDNELNTRVFNGSLLNSGRPALIMGAGTKTVPPINKVMFAWNGAPEAAKAMHHSLPWLQEAAEANIVVVDPDEYRTGPNPGDDVATFLARRNLKVTVDRLPSGQRDVSEVLLEHANDINADLLVMGAYGRSRFREWLLGGTTRDVLGKSNVPVLMAH